MFRRVKSLAFLAKNGWNGIEKIGINKIGVEFIYWFLSGEFLVLGGWMRYKTSNRIISVLIYCVNELRFTLNSVEFLALS